MEIKPHLICSSHFNLFLKSGQLFMPCVDTKYAENERKEIMKYNID